MQQSAQQYRPSPRPEPASAPAPGAPRGRLASVAAQLHRGAAVQRLAAGPMESPRTSAMRSAIAHGSLTKNQVRMPPISQDLPAHEVGRLAQRVAATHGGAARPIAAAVASGRATVNDTGVTIAAPAPASTGEGIAQSLASLNPHEARVSLSGDTYSVSARLNPWILFANGKITAFDAGPWNKTMPGWTFVKVGDLKKNGVDLNNPIGGKWPPGYTPPIVMGGLPQYTVPSQTFNPSNMSPGFHNLPTTHLPNAPTGGAWGKDTNNQWHMFYDPVQVPQSPQYNVEEYGTQHGTSMISSIHDNLAPDNRIPLGFSFETSDTHYKGQRDYPMTSDDYEDNSGVRYGRGHGVDHAHGNQTTTSISVNYTPQNRHFNEGLRNHAVRKLDEGSLVQEHIDYGQNPQRTSNGMPIPQTYHFMTTDTGSNQTYWQIDNSTYPPHRSMDTGDPFKQPPTTFPFAKNF